VKAIKDSTSREEMAESCAPCQANRAVGRFKLAAPISGLSALNSGKHDGTAPAEDEICFSLLGRYHRESCCTSHDSLIEHSRGLLMLCPAVGALPDNGLAMVTFSRTRCGVRAPPRGDAW